MLPNRETVLRWLKRLAEQKLLVLSPRTILETERLLRHLMARGVEDPSEYGCALASLLAKDEAQWRKLVEHFHGYFAECIAVFEAGKRRRLAENPEEDRPALLPTPLWAGYRHLEDAPPLPRRKQWLQRIPPLAWTALLGVGIGATIAATIGVLVWATQRREPLGTQPPSLSEANEGANKTLEASTKPLLANEQGDGGFLDAQAADAESGDAGALNIGAKAENAAAHPQKPEIPPSEASSIPRSLDAGPPDKSTSTAETSPSADETPELVQFAEQHTIQRPTSTEARPLRGPAWLYGVLSALSAMLGLFAARFLFANRIFQADVRESWKRADEERRELMKEVGQRGVLYHLEPAPPMPSSTLDDAATLLGRLTRREAGFELDEPGTIDKSIEAGGRIIPVYAPGRRTEALLVLVDMEDGHHPFLDAVEYVLARWHRLGVPMIRYNFSERPMELKRHQDAQPITLEALGRRHEDAPLLIFSRMVRAQDKRGRYDWLKRYFAGSHQAWPNRAWVDLDPRIPSERSKDGQRTLRQITRFWQRYPFTREGLIACASSLLSRGQKKKAPEEYPLLNETDPGVEEALKLWAAAAACVPDPEWEHLDSLRRELPEVAKVLGDRRYVQRLLSWVRRNGYFEGDLGMGACIRLTREARRELLVWLRVWDGEHFTKIEDGVEYRTRRLLIRQLEAAAVGTDAYDRKKRDMKKAVHEAILEPSKVEQLLKEYGESGVAEELRELLEDEVDRQEKAGLSVLSAGRWTGRTREYVEGWTRGREGVRLRDLGTLWRWNEWQGIAAAVILVVGVSSWGGWWRWWMKPQAQTSGGSLLTVTIPATWKAAALKKEFGKAIKSPERDALAYVAPMRFMRLPGGLFWMGSPLTESARSNNETRHGADVRPFEIGTHEVTQKQWTAVMGTKPFDCDSGCGDELPAQNISWEDALGFMNKLTELENKTLPGGKKWTLCYAQKEGKWIWDRKCTGYRLPTEAEWEYAARAGTETAYSFGEDEKELCKHGNGADISAKRKHTDWTVNEACDDGYADLAPVGKFQANPWGLYDVHGNVWEWVWDGYAPYPKAAEAGYAGPETAANKWRVVRGGSFVNEPGWLRSSDRSWFGPADWFRLNGFRCVRGAPQP